MTIARPDGWVSEAGGGLRSSSCLSMFGGAAGQFPAVSQATEDRQAHEGPGKEEDSCYNRRIHSTPSIGSAAPSLKTFRPRDDRTWDCRGDGRGPHLGVSECFCLSTEQVPCRRWKLARPRAIVAVHPSAIAGRGGTSTRSSRGSQMVTGMYRYRFSPLEGRIQWRTIQQVSRDRGRGSGASLAPRNPGSCTLKEGSRLVRRDRDRAGRGEGRPRGGEGKCDGGCRMLDRCLSGDESRKDREARGTPLCRPRMDERAFSG